MRLVGWGLVTLIFSMSLWAQQTLPVSELEYYGGRFRQAIREGRVPKMSGGMFDFYQIEHHMQTLNHKQAKRLMKEHEKERRTQYGELASIMYRPISKIFDIRYEPDRVRDPKRFFNSFAGVELLTKIMDQYVLDDGTLDSALLFALLAIFDDSVISQVSAHIKPIINEYAAVYLLAHPFKRAEQREQILNRAIGVLMFAYYPYVLAPSESWLMWEEAKYNPKHLVHKFSNLEYDAYHRLMAGGVVALAKLTNSGTTMAERERFNQFLLQDIFDGSQIEFNLTLNASRQFLRSDKFMQNIFIPY